MFMLLIIIALYVFIGVLMMHAEIKYDDFPITDWLDWSIVLILVLSWPVWVKYFLSSISKEKGN